jgi:hypothetical protein
MLKYSMASKKTWRVIFSIMTEEDDDLCCPITKQLFIDPVTAEDGHVQFFNGLMKNERVH